MVWILAMWEDQEWEAIGNQVDVLWEQLPDQDRGTWSGKAREWLHHWHHQNWPKLRQLHDWWTLDPSLRRAIQNHQIAMAHQGYDARQPDWARHQ